MTCPALTGGVFPLYRMQSPAGIYEKALAAAFTAQVIESPQWAAEPSAKRTAPGRAKPGGQSYQLEVTGPGFEVIGSRSRQI